MPNREKRRTAVKRSTARVEPSRDVRIDETTVSPGQRVRLELFAARLPTQTRLNIPIEVINGRHKGPRLWLSAAIHGDELNGMEIIHRVLERIKPATLHGELIAVPVVNVFGFIQQDRYFPDRRDLNRCFPGSARGSLASRIAHLFMTQIVGHCTHGIDFHTGSLHRVNLPQIRGNLRHAETRRMAAAFGAPLLIQGDSPHGSLRDACERAGIPVIVYEAGGPQRFNPGAIRAGVKGTLRVMAELGMIRRKVKPGPEPIWSTRRVWVRANRSGILRLNVKLGEHVRRGQALGSIHDAFGDTKSLLGSPLKGVIIGHTNNPLVNQGDAIVHVARDTRR